MSNLYLMGFTPHPDKIDSQLIINKCNYGINRIYEIENSFYNPIWILQI